MSENSVPRRSTAWWLQKAALEDGVEDVCAGSVNAGVYDRLWLMFEDQREFMNLLREKRGFPDFPLDLSTKENQAFCKKIVHETQDELYEVVRELKNSKDHRLTEVKDFDLRAVTEELVDTIKYCLELCHLMGIDDTTLFDAFKQKSVVNRSRIIEGY